MLVQRQMPADASPDRSGLPLQSTDLHLPPNVEAVLAARIDRLSIGAKHLLQTAAVVGVDVPISLLRLVAESTESAFNAHLAELQAAELLNEGHRFRENFRLAHARHRAAKLATWMECRSQGEPEINGLLARVTSVRQMREGMNRLLEV